MALSREKKIEKIKASPKLWIKNFIKIIDSEGNEVRFIPNKEQEYFLDNMTRYNAIGKSRQLGFTTLNIAIMLYFACNNSNRTYLLLSYDQPSVQNIFERMKFMYSTIPDEFKPKEARNNRQELKLKNGSRIVVKVAGNRDLGRSFTNSGIHCSEFAFWSEYQQTKGLISLENSLSKEDDAYINLETTSNGFNAWQKLFCSAMKGESKYKAFFFNWINNKKMFKKEYDLAEQWFKDTGNGDRIRPKDLEKDEMELVEKYRASLKQIMWRKWKLIDMDEDEFNQEFPAHYMESFISTGSSVFDTKIITQCMQYLPEPLKEEEIIIPLPDDLRIYLNKSLFIYKNIEPGRYYMGVDPSSGSGNDYYAICIFDADGEQVCQFYHNKLPLYISSKATYNLGHYWNTAFMVVEKNNIGASVIEKMRKEYDPPYLNMYKQKVFDNGQKRLKIGFTSTAVTKNKAVQDFKESFELGMIQINDRRTLDELLIYKENKDGKMGNKRGTDLHDDCAYSAFLALVGMKAGRWYNFD
ncbi:MAG: hypothetical protein PHY55_03850 [Bacteroidales bacterium]|nr:hypothetical protein [Bacteroidales bacterium]